MINNNIVECYDFRKIRPFLLKNFFGGKVENNSLDYDKILSYVVGNIISTMAEIRIFHLILFLQRKIFIMNIEKLIKNVILSII